MKTQNFQSYSVTETIIIRMRVRECLRLMVMLRKSERKEEPEYHHFRIVRILIIKVETWLSNQ